MDDLTFLAEHFDKELIDRLRFVLDKPFKRMTYTEGIEILEAAVKAGRNSSSLSIGVLTWRANMSAIS